MYHWKQQPMLDLIDEMNKRGFWNTFFPSTSHAALGLSKKFRYDERCANPMVYIEYKSDAEEFVIHYQEGQGNTIKENSVSGNMSESDFMSIFKWLE